MGSSAVGSRATSSIRSEKLTIDNATGGVPLTPGIYRPTENARCWALTALVTCETAQIRFTYDGTAPTSTVGHILDPGQSIALEGYATISTFKAIRTGSTNGTLQVTYHSADTFSPIYVKEVLADSPAGYWRLGELSGTTALDRSGNALNGTYSGGYTLAQGGALTNDPDTAVRFIRASSGKVAVADNNLLDLGDTFTLEVWFKLAQTGLAQTLVSKGQNAYELGITNGNLLKLGRPGVADIVTSTTTVTDTTTWHHAVATKTGSTVRLYLDGADVTGTVTNSTFTNNSLALNIGANPQDGFYFDGHLDEVAVYSTALSAARVKAHYDAR